MLLAARTASRKLQAKVWCKYNEIHIDWSICLHRFENEEYLYLITQ